MIKSTKIIRVDVKRGANCRTPSTMSVAIEKADLSNVLEYMDSYEASETPTGKIRKIELVMYYEEDLQELNKEEIFDKLEEITTSGSKLIEDVIIEQDSKDINMESLEHLNHQYNNGWIADEYYNKRKAELCEKLPANQPDLDIYEGEES